MKSTFPNAMRSMLLVSLLLAGVVSSVAATGSYAPPLTDVDVVIPFPSTTYGGSIDTAHYRLTFADKATLVLQVEVCHPLLEQCGEWRAGCCIDGTLVEIEEIAPGVFRSAPRDVAAGIHDVEVDLEPLPNIYPDCYDFVVTFHYLPCTPTPQGGGGGGGGYVSVGGGGGSGFSALPTPTPTPTGDGGGSGESTPPASETPTPTPTPTSSPSGSDAVTGGGNLGWIIMICIGSVIVVILAVAWRLKLMPF